MLGDSYCWGSRAKLVVRFCRRFGEEPMKFSSAGESAYNI